MNKLPILVVSAFAALVALANNAGLPGTGPGVRYATDAFPGFDIDKDALQPERKEPRWFQFITGPKCDSPSAQMTYCRELETNEKWSKAIYEYDALVRNWPTSAEAPVAQRRMAELLAEKEDDSEEAFVAYRYLIDFYSFKCDYNAVVDKLYELAGVMRQEGKTIVFFRFKNTVDVRRAFEAAVLRGPGASWTPQAMLTIGELREDEGRDAEAVVVYENLRNLHYGSSEAREAVAREAVARMRLLRAYGYNRERCRDTVAFLKLAMKIVDTDRVSEIESFLVEAEGVMEDEAYRAACFYDTRMRTKRSAANAYENFLRDYPDSVHAGEIRQRLENLKGQK